MSGRRCVTKVVYDAEGIYSNKDAFPENLREAIAWLQAKLDSLPADMRDEASIEIEADSYYDSPILKMKIDGSRLETNDEMTARERAEAAKAEGERFIKEQIERAAYEALRRKYGDKP